MLVYFNKLILLTQPSLRKVATVDPALQIQSFLTQQLSVCRANR